MVTGATRGLGRALATRLAEAGAKVVVVGRSTSESPHSILPGTLDDVEADLKGRGFDVLAVRADLSKVDDAQKVVDETLAWQGRCDICISNAAYTPAGGFFDIPLPRWATAWNINVYSTVIINHGFLEGMLERKHGRILHVGSSQGEYGIDPPEDWQTRRRDGHGTPALYGVTKSALERFTRSMHDSFGGQGVQFMNLRAGQMSSESWYVMTQKMGLSNDPTDVHTPAEIAKGSLWLLEHAEDYDGKIVDFRWLQDHGAIPVKV